VSVCPEVEKICVHASLSKTCKEHNIGIAANDFVFI
jgi:hypothetical protein